jgi:hypothetical protein
MACVAFAKIMLMAPTPEPPPGKRAFEFEWHRKAERWIGSWHGSGSREAARWFAMGIFLLMNPPRNFFL